MSRLLVLSAVFALSCAWTGCGDDSEDDEEGEEELPEVDCDDGPVVEYEDVAAFDKCQTCHDSAKEGSERNGAEEDVNFDTEAAAKKSALKAVEEVEEGEMPPKDSGIKLTASEKEALYRWAFCTD